MEAIFKVLKPGLQTTVQDLGRYGYQQYGISPSGAMDTYSMQVANILVGNPNGEAVLEAAIIGPEIEALNDVAIAICGGNFTPKVDGEEVSMWKSFLLRKGQVLTVGHCHRGARAYIAIGGSIDVPFVLGSKSTLLNGKFGGFEGRALQKGDVLVGNPLIRKPYKMLHPELVPQYAKEMTIRVVIGPHENRFTEESIRRFCSEEYVVTHQANRMGYQLKGPKLEHIGGPDIISDPIPLGGIQVPASGQPIILLADRQTTGGYTRIGTVISADIPKVAQAVPDTILHFSMVSVEEAQQHYLERLRLLKYLQLGAAK
ncbi:biotin-dependent carboxyltransferase family protein [Neobacillus drentensis]|uniref:5-oxoprolinase subunit C family protein n=1 Tax=Neobacillus drentensis TaxID=220684 RepID=UPI001F17DEDD|nr:biotin-dependent carboxyltransferase family protein [Neobacillus drentensis]ULT56224.1 biotin-dependent carboxyltransferase family protein [Neobacillus drentensis]